MNALRGDMQASEVIYGPRCFWWLQLLLAVAYEVALWLQFSGVAGIDALVLLVSLLLSLSGPVVQLWCRQLVRLCKWSSCAIVVQAVGAIVQIAVGKARLTDCQRHLHMAPGSPDCQRHMAPGDELQSPVRAAGTRHGMPDRVGIARARLSDCQCHLQYGLWFYVTEDDVAGDAFQGVSAGRAIAEAQTQ